LFNEMWISDLSRNKGSSSVTGQGLHLNLLG